MIKIKGILRPQSITVNLPSFKEHVKVSPTDNKDMLLSFSPSDIVSNNGSICEVIRVGSNYLTVLMEDGSVKKVWPSDCVKLDEHVDFITPLINTSNLPDNIKNCFLESYNKFNVTFTDLFCLYSAFQHISEHYKTHNFNDIKKAKSLLETINQSNHSYIKEVLTMSYTEDDKLKVANLFAKTFGTEIQSTPRETVIEALNSSKCSSLQSSHIAFFNKMLDLAEEVGVYSDDDEDEEIKDEEIDELVSDDDIMNTYDDEELSVIDSETGEKIDEELTVTEVLSKMERIKARIRFARTEANRHRKLQIALNRKSSSDVLAKRARRLAVKAIERRIARKDLDKLTVAEKERVERKISKMGKVVSRVATRMIARVRNLEKERLSHPKFTQESK